MAGNITKRGESRWQVKVFLGRDPETGKQKFHNKTIHGTKKDAQVYLNKVLRDRDLGTWVELSTLPLSTYLDRWLTEADTSTRKNNERNNWAIGHYIKPVLGAIPLGRLSPMDVQGLYNSLTQRGLSPATVRRVHNILSSALGTALEWEMLARNPAERVKLPAMRKTKMQVLDADEVRRFLDAAKGDRYCTLWHLALETGMRPEEYLGLKWRDLDLKGGAVELQQALHWLKGGVWEFSDLKSDASRRKIRLSGELAHLLGCHRKKQAEQRLAAGARWQDHDLVFPSTNGGPQRIENLTVRHFKPLLKAAGGPLIRLYDLRHTSATLLLKQGVHVKIVSERLGHADVALTLNTYSHVLPDMQQDATRSIGRLLYL